MPRTEGVYLDFEDFATPYEGPAQQGASPAAGDAPKEG